MTNTEAMREQFEKTPMVFNCCGKTECDGTCPNGDSAHYKVPAWRMRAYHYGFTETGVAAIDRILSAVACAGKGYHNTADWRDQADGREWLRGETPEEWIQNAADDAATALASRSSEDKGVPEGWLPIESAPKDGTHILLANKSGASEGGWLSDLDHGADWEGQIGMAGWWRSDSTDWPNTHWMPLPKPPAPPQSAPVDGGGDAA